MKKVLLYTMVFIGLACASVVPGRLAAAASCAGVLCSGGSSSPCANPHAITTPVICGDNGTGQANPIVGPKGILTKIVSLVLYIVGAAAVIMVVISGIRMITANGDTSAFTSARTGLIYALIGLAVALLAQAIVIFIISKL